MRGSLSQRLATSPPIRPAISSAPNATSSPSSGGHGGRNQNGPCMAISLGKAGQAWLVILGAGGPLLDRAPARRVPGAAPQSPNAAHTPAGILFASPNNMRLFFLLE